MKNILITCAALLALSAPAFAQSFPATTIADAKRGTMVTLEGVVDRITDEDEFRLRDATGTIEVDLGPNWMPADEGERVTVQGFMDDDFGPKEVYARTLTRSDGTVITFERGDD
jgi:uncharacterized protein YdeI (BOF family)